MDGVPVMSLQWKKGQGCLSVEGGLLYRQHHDPAIMVQFIPVSVYEKIVLWAYVNTGHGNWEVTWHTIRKRGYFPKLMAKYRELIRPCGACRAANPSGGEVPRSVNKDDPVRAWDIVQSIRWSWTRSTAAHTTECLCALTCS